MLSQMYNHIMIMNCLNHIQHIIGHRLLTGYSLSIVQEFTV